jgi:hypothetical protein
MRTLRNVEFQTRRIISGVSALAFLATAACQQVPTGPTASEGLYNSLVVQCNAQGGRDRRGNTACAEVTSLAVQVSAERAQRDAQVASVSQNNAVVAGVATGAALLGAALLGNATASHRHVYCGPYWC